MIHEPECPAANLSEIARFVEIAAEGSLKSMWCQCEQIRSQK